SFSPSYSPERIYAATRLESRAHLYAHNWKPHSLMCSGMASCSLTGTHPFFLACSRLLLTAIFLDEQDAEEHVGGEGHQGEEIEGQPADGDGEEHRGDGGDEVNHVRRALL